MLAVVVILFIIAAFFGLMVLRKLLKGQHTKAVVVLMHGLFALLGLFLLIRFVLSNQTSPLLLSSMIVLIAAAFGGATLFYMSFRKMPLSKALALGHPIIALSGLGLLIAYVLQKLF